MSDKKSLYLKYRPIQLDDIVGQRHIVATLKQASIRKEFSHAYLFSGNHGCGKTSSARILASLMECENVKDGKVCGICRSCKTIQAGACSDVKELDGASNRGIDSVKSLIDAAQWSPQEFSKKVYLIDECLSGQTRIDTDQGLMYIRDIVNKKLKIRVLSYNEQTKNIEYRPVIGWFKNSGKNIYKLGFESKGRIYPSSNHLIRTPLGFKKVEELSVGDLVCRTGVELTDDQKQLILITEKLTIKEPLRFEKTTYDLEVECNHNYFASGTLVHNCHQLTKEATSALLKTLEEPPSYLNFILCTTEINKILPTILSRCQRFNFSKIMSVDISQRLMFIAKNENINIDEDAVNVMSKMSRGSMRDAIGYLEQIGTVAAGKKITIASIQRYFGVTDRLAIFNIIKSIVEGNIPLILDQINDIIMASADCKQILLEISEMFRNIMVIKAQNGISKNIDLPDSEVEDLKKLGELINLSQLLKLAHLFSDVEKKIVFNINERWITEATLINCVSILRKQQ